MTLVEAETIEVADISGDWNFAAGSGAYDTMEGSVIPTDFSIALTKSGDDNLAYTATIAIEGYDNVELPATFDGNTLALAYDDTYLDETKGIRFAPMYGSAKKGTIEFKSQSRLHLLSTAVSHSQATRWVRPKMRLPILCMLTVSITSGISQVL